MPTIVGRTNKAIGSPITRPSVMYRRSTISMTNSTAAKSSSTFDRQQLVVKPRRGLLLAFPSDAAHTHEVLPVRSGVRYTMPIWFTKQRRFALADFPWRDPVRLGTYLSVSQKPTSLIH